MVSDTDVLDMHRTGRSPDLIVQAIHANDLNVIADDRTIVDVDAYNSTLAKVQSTINAAARETAYLALKAIADFEPRLVHYADKVRDYLDSLEPKAAEPAPVETPIDESAAPTPDNPTPTKKGK